MALKIFVTGITGSIGGSAVKALKSRNPELEVTALVRSDTYSKALKDVGITVVKGTLDDVELIAQHSAEADVVINTADCDHLPSAEAIFEGFKKRSAAGKPRGILIHTSGGAVFVDEGTEGVFADATPCIDTDEQRIRAIKATDPHGNVDVPVLEAGLEDYVNTYIICPAAVIGPSAGYTPAESIWHKFFIPGAVKAGAASYVGEGSNVFKVVFLSDVTDMFVKVFDFSLTERDTKPNPYERYYFVGSDGVSIKQMAEQTALALHDLGLLSSPATKSVDPKEVSKYGLPTYLLGNINAISERGRGLGWNASPVSLEAYREEMRLVLGRARLGSALRAWARLWRA